MYMYKTVTNQGFEPRTLLSKLSLFDLCSVQFLVCTLYFISFHSPLLSSPGKHNGTVKDHEYFKCKDKHGVFVRPEKIIRHDKVSSVSSPSHSPSPSRGTSGVSGGRLRHTSTSPSNPRRLTPSTHTSSSRSLHSARRSSSGHARF